VIQNGSNYYIAHPKTASVSTVRALMEKGWKGVGQDCQSHGPGHHSIYPFPAGSRCICVVREPRDWLVSWYHYLGKRNKQPFHEWLPTFRTPLQLNGLEFYGVPFSTHVIFFSELQEGWNAVMDDLRRPRIELPHENVSIDREKPTASYFENSQVRTLYSERYGDLDRWYQALYASKEDDVFLKRL